MAPALSLATGRRGSSKPRPTVPFELEGTLGQGQHADHLPTRRWLPSRPKTGDSSIRSKSRGRTADKKDTVNSPALQLSRQHVQEFETLPVAVRRKYFSTLERLRLAQTSGALDDNFGPENHHLPPRSFTISNDGSVQRSSSLTPGSLAPRNLNSPSQTSICRARTISTDRLAITSSQHHLTRQEQVALARNLRESVILDAADEAIYKIGRRASRQISPLSSTSAAFSARPSMEFSGRKMNSRAHGRHDLDAFYDSFRWLEADDDLDLSLQLDDYHANLKESLPRPSKEHRPSFRRHLSINKIPFGRSSVHAGQPGTNTGNSASASTSVSASASPSPLPPPATQTPHARRKSRGLSIMNPTRHVSQGSTASIDPYAAHYQDPEARAKLRVYLASPSKFDEAVEFGFPSNDAVTAPTHQGSYTSRSHPRKVASQDSSRFQTFFSDDRSSIYSDDDSLPDPESPRTPHSPDKAESEPDTLGNGHIRKMSDNYAQIPAASREMTLRMTLTRRDLRACEDQIYGWQKGPEGQQASKQLQTAPTMGELSPVRKTYIGDTNKPQENLEAFFASLDQEEEMATESGGFKRFWNRVRRT